MGGPRRRPIQGICVHTTENPWAGSALGVADYQINSNTGSYHVIVDDHGRIVLCNTDDWTTWSTGNQGNDVLLHVSAVAYAKSTRAEWLAHPVVLESIAKVIAEWHRRHGVPLVKLTRNQLAAGTRGVVGHIDTQVWGGTSHWDPGTGFPYDVVLKRATEIAAGATVPPKAPEPSDDGAMTNNSAAEAARDHAADNQIQLRGPGLNGWDQLGGRTLVDAVAAIGEKLGVEGMKEPR